MLKPIDEGAVVESARASELVVTLEDHFLVGGLHSIVAELFVRRGLLRRVLPIAFEERWFKPAMLENVLEYEGFTGGAIARRILKALKPEPGEGEATWPTE
jgi:transketolase